MIQSRYTRRFGLIMLGEGDELNLEDYRFTHADRALLDQLIRQAIEGHEHTGASAVSALVAPVLRVVPAQGTLPAHRLLSYRVALVDSKGQESAPSPMATVVTPSSLPAPGPLAATVILGGAGALPAGDYLYQVTAYAPSTGYETTGSPAVQRSLGSAGAVTLTMPVVPDGALGWNIYRKGPYDFEPHFLVSLPRSQTQWVDNGTATANALRSVPSMDTTAGANAISVDLPGGLPAGTTCKIFRTVDTSDWSRSLVVRTATLPYVDVGTATQTGGPLVHSSAMGGAPKIILTDLAEVTGTLPPVSAQGHELATWMIPGPVEVRTSSWYWTNEFDRAAVTAVRASLAGGSVPAMAPVIVEVGITRAEEWFPDGESFNHLIATVSIPPGTNSSGSVNPSATGADIELVPGDGLGIKITQSGGGATPTDYDLSVVVTLATRTGTTMTHQWST